MDSYGISGQPTTVKNPAANGLIERVHLTIGDQLRMITFEGSDFYDELDRITQAIAWSIRTTVPSNIQYSPAQLVFGINMIFCQIKNVKKQQRGKSKADTSQLSSWRPSLIVKLADERAKQGKLDCPTEGPYTIMCVFDNGTVRIIRGTCDEVINTRRRRPYNIKH